MNIKIQKAYDGSFIASERQEDIRKGCICGGISKGGTYLVNKNCPIHGTYKK